MASKNRFSSSLVLVHLISVLFALALAAYFYAMAWGNFINDAGDDTVRDVTAVSAILKSTIAEGTKFLELAGQNVEKTIAAKHVSVEHLERALNDGLDNFRLLNDLRSYGILFLTNDKGQLIARSDGKPVVPTDFSDRYYFRSMAANPQQELVVGPMLKARTTGRTVFHVAIPIHTADQKFFGVLALQLDVHHIIRRINEESGAPKGQVSTVSNGHQVVLRMPLPAPEDYGSNGMLFTPMAGLPEPSPTASWFELSRNVVAHIAVPELKLAVFSDLAKSKIWDVYVQSYVASVFLILFGLFVYSGLMWVLNRNIQKLAQERISALTDRLTGLLNRRAFDERYQTLLQVAHRNRQPVSVLFIDIDHFKNCNDRYGHDNGDLVLKRVAELVQSALHRPLDCCFRWGGEELVCLLEDTHEKGAVMVAERILDSVRQADIEIHGCPPIHVTVSIGIATAHYSGKPILIDLVGAADHAMYRAKQSGRDRLDVAVVIE